MPNQAQKTVNYDDATVEKMVQVYTAAGSATTPEGEAARDKAMEEIQAFTGKSIPSIRSKLGNLKVYIAKNKVTTKKSDRVTKSDLVSDLSKLANKHEGFFDSIEGANKTVIEYVIELVTASKAIAENQEVQAVLSAQAEAEAEVDETSE